MDANEMFGAEFGHGNEAGASRTHAGEVADEDEEIFACNTGTEEDRVFDSVIGVIEQIMVSDGLRRLLPRFFKSQPQRSELDDHQRHLAWKAYLKLVDDFVDAEVQKQLPDHLSLQQVAELIIKRKDEVSDDVMELVTGASLDYVAFDELWEANSGKARQQ
jgi:hypothetical protein